MNNNGFISIMALLIMGIILVSTSFLVYTSKMEYLIINSNKNSIQSYYSGEGKILRLLYQDKYYNNELLPRIKKRSNCEIVLDEKDLIEGDTEKRVEIAFSEEDNREIMTLRTRSIVNNNPKEISAKVNIIKDFYELKIPILYENILNEEKRQEYIKYMSYLEKKIGINDLDNDIMGIESIDYDNIVISRDIDNEQYIEFYRNNIDRAIKSNYINKDQLFLVIKGSTNLWFKSDEKDDKLILNGVIYTEGDIEINSNLDFCGILILNKGKINISPNVNLKLQGIILSRDYPFEALDSSSENEIKYNKNYIKKNGIYLPGYIEPKIKVLKSL